MEGHLLLTDTLGLHLKLLYCEFQKYKGYEHIWSAKKDKQIPVIKQLFLSLITTNISIN